MNDTREDLDESDFEFILIEYNREALRFCFVFFDFFVFCN